MKRRNRCFLSSPLVCLAACGAAEDMTDPTVFSASASEELVTKTPATLSEVLQEVSFAANDKANADSSSPNVGCLTFKCGIPLAKCGLEGSCRKTLECVKSCTSDDPDERQRCTITCVESTPSKAFAELSACMVKKKCVAPSSQSTCSLPRNPSVIAPMTLHDLEGPWFVARGLSRAYDCWPCQQMTFRGIDNQHSKYDYDYMVVPDRLTRIECNARPAPSATANAGRFSIDYEAYGVPGTDDWHVLSFPHPDYALVYYCGATAMAGQYRGAVMMSRIPAADMPDDILNTFESALTDAQLEPSVSVAQFCSVDHNDCQIP